MFPPLVIDDRRPTNRSLKLAVGHADVVADEDQEAGMAYRRAIAYVAAVIVLLGAGAAIALASRSDSRANESVNLDVERARNTATAQAACYSAGGTWKVPTGPIGPAPGPSAVSAEVRGTCVSAAEMASKKADAESYFQSCMSGRAEYRAKADGEKKTLADYCFEGYKLLEGG